MVRMKVFAHFFGNSDAGDAFNAAIKIPNLLQNLFGEGVLSASFIPVYARLRAEGKDLQAGRVAGVIASLLCLVVSVIVLGGVILTPWAIDLIAPGFTGEKRALTIRLVQIIFPGTGILVMSAWCLGVLNSHRRFFLPYAAPVLMNLVMIATLWVFGRERDQSQLSLLLAWGSVVGSALQFGVQLPLALHLVKNFRLGIQWRLPEVQSVVAGFLPVVLTRGVVQISAYIDTMLASLLPTGAVSALTYTQAIYLLPISLFGMSVSAAELPAMSSITGNESEIYASLRSKLNSGLRKIAFFIVPAVVAFLALGDVIIAVLYQGGQFGSHETKFVWFVLIGSSVGLLAAALGRLYSSTYYALKDTRSPLKFAAIRVALTTVLGVVFGLYFPRWIGVDASLGTVGLTATAGISGWVEFLLLRRKLNRRIGPTGLAFSYLLQLWVAALVGAAGAWGLRLSVGPQRPLLSAILFLGFYGLIYVGLTFVMKVPETQQLKRFLRR